MAQIPLKLGMANIPALKTALAYLVFTWVKARRKARKVCLR